MYTLYVNEIWIQKIIIKIHKFWEKFLIHILKQCFIFKKYKKLTVHTYDKKKQCILNNDYHKAYQIIPKKTASKLYKKPATKSYKNLLQNYTKNLLQNNTKTCNKIFWNKVFLLQFYCNNKIMSLRPSSKNNFVFLNDTSLKLCRLAFIQRYDFANNGLIKSYLRRLECCCLIHYINLLRKKNCTDV